MPRCHNVLDSDSDEEIGWSRTKDLPQNRDSRALEDHKRAVLEAFANNPETKLEIPNTLVLRGPNKKRIKFTVKEIVETETEEEHRRRMSNWPEKLLKKLIKYVPVDDRIKLRCTCKAMRDLVDSQNKLITHEIIIRRLDETEVGLFIPEHRKEARFVIHNKNFTWQERPLLRTMPEMRRGMVNWTRHHRTRMGRIRTAIKSIFNISWVLRINVEQVNLSNSFIRDICRVIRGTERACVYSLDLRCQYFEQERPDLALLDDVPCKSIALSIRLSEREPLPHMERFLNIAINSFKQIIIDVRQDSWKFKSTLHYRKSYEEYGINDAALMHYMSGEECNFLRLKVICRYITQEGIFNTILQLRTRDPHLPTRGFCVLINREQTDDFIKGLIGLPKFGQRIQTPQNTDNTLIYQTTKEYLEIRDIKQNVGKQELSEVRYWRNGCDDDEEYINSRCDDMMLWDPFEQPKFVQRPV